MLNMDGQDWNPTVIKGVSKIQGDTKKTLITATTRANRIIESMEVARVKYLSIDSVKILQDYRRVNGLTQIQLDQACAFPKATINAIEGRRLPPTPNQMNVLKRKMHGLVLD